MKLLTAVLAGWKRTTEKKAEEAGFSSPDSWSVFYYECGQVDLALPCGLHSSPLCLAFDFELWPIVPHWLDGRPIVIQSFLIHALDSGVSGKGKVAAGERRLPLFWCVFFFLFLCVKWPSGSNTKAFCRAKKQQRSFNIKQQIAVVAADYVILAEDIFKKVPVVLLKQYF